MRKVLVHYHLFKNAGSSIDRCLKSSFDTAWHAFDPESPRGNYTANELRQIIRDQPDAVAFSSHCLVPPIPDDDDLKVYPIIVLRDPLSRVLSAYTFEWQKQKGTDAPIGGLDEYIHSKFKMRRRNAIENFQTMKLSVTGDDQGNPDSTLADSELLGSACKVIDSLPAFGLVEQFNESVNWLQNEYTADFPALELQPVAANVTRTDNLSLSARHKEIADLIGTELYQELLMRNQMDIELYAYASGRFNALSRAA